MKDNGLAVLGYGEIRESPICIMTFNEVLICIPVTQLCFPGVGASNG